MTATIKNLGPVTAYGLAKKAGYTGTKEQFAAGLVESAEAAQTATTKAGIATAAAAAALESEGKAKTSEDNAKSSEDSAADSASACAANLASMLEIIQIPVGHAYNIGVTENNNVVSVTWTDPKDNVTDDGATLAYWKKTRLIYKIGGFPENENDGVVLVDNTVRNQYSDTPFTFDMGVTANYCFAIFTCTTGNLWNTSESAPRFTINYITFATIRQMIRSGIPLSTIGLNVGGVVNIQTSTRFPKLRWKLVHNDYHGFTMHDNTLTHNAVFIPQYLPCNAGTDSALQSQFDAPELSYAITDDEVFITSKAYYKLVDSSYVALVENTDWTAGDNIAQWSETHSIDVYTKNHANRVSNGCNSWKMSNRRQMMNAYGTDYFQQQNIYDKQSSYSDFSVGMLSGFNADFLELVMPVYNKTARNTIAVKDGGGGGGYDTTLDTLWLPSLKEVFGSNVNGIAEGEQFDYFQNIAVANADRIQYDEGGTARNAWLRSAYATLTNAVYYISTSGASSNANASNAYALLLAMCIA